MMIFVFTLCIVLLLDLLAKLWAISPFFVPAVLIKNYIYLTLHMNPGVAFGIDLPGWIVIPGSLAAILFLIYLLFSSPLKNQRLNLIFMGMAVGGALGNLINRFFTGSVIDFIYIYPIPVFNVADMGITVGLLGLVLYNYTKH